MSELKIIIPDSFSKKLAGTEWERVVKHVISTIQPFLERDSKFFPEYTMHGIDHINHVIEIAKKLIPDSIINDSALLTGKDIGILLCSILIHDLGIF